MSGSTSTAGKRDLGRTTIRGQLLRFLVFGGANTLISSVTFYGLAIVLPPRVAFTLVYFAGLAVVVVAMPRYVFGSSTSWARRVLLGLWYLGTYAVGIGVITVLRAELSAPRAIVVLGTVMVTAPLSFAGGRLIVAGRG
jgi:putative flippase GtrA